MADTIRIGKVKKIKKFITTLKFRKNIIKNKFIVVFGFKIESFVDSQIAWKTLLFSKTIKNLVYENKIFIIIQKIKIIKKI